MNLQTFLDLPPQALIALLHRVFEPSGMLEKGHAPALLLLVGGYGLVPVLLSLLMVVRGMEVNRALAAGRRPPFLRSGRAIGNVVALWPLVAGAIAGRLTALHYPQWQWTFLLMGQAAQSLALIVLAYWLQRLNLVLQRGPEAVRTAHFDRTDRFQNLLYYLAASTVPVWSYVFSSAGHPFLSAFAAALFLFALLYVSFAIFMSQLVVVAPQQAARRDDDPDWLRLTPLEAGLLRLIRRSGRHTVWRIAMAQTFPPESLKGNPAAWRRWFTRQHAACFAGFQPGSPSLTAATVRVVPPESLLAALSTRILGTRRTRLRLLIRATPVLRYALPVLDVLPMRPLVMFIALYALLVYALSAPFSPLAAPGIAIRATPFVGLVLSAMILFASAVLLSLPSRHSLRHGFQGWQSLPPPGGDGAQSADDQPPLTERVAQYLVHIAVHDAILLDNRRPEAVSELLLANPQVGRLLKWAGMTTHGFPRQRLEAAVADAMAELEEESGRGGCQRRPEAERGG